MVLIDFVQRNQRREGEKEMTGREPVFNLRLPVLRLGDQKQLLQMLPSVPLVRKYRLGLRPLLPAPLARLVPIG
jgi:hypothetical protein